MAYTTSVAGTAITASWANASVRDQGVSVFTDSTARATAITVPVDGMISTLTTTDRVDVYNGSSWSALVAPSNGALTTWTPVITQSVNVTFNTVISHYIRIGRLVIGWYALNVTGAGTAANAVQITGIPFTAASSGFQIGAGQIFDNSAALNYPGLVYQANTTTLDMRATTVGAAADNRLGVLSFTAALAVNDSVNGFFAYEAAADA